MQPCFSPVWDTAQVLSTLGEAGVPKNDPRLVKAADWLLSKEIRYKGDWSHNVKNVDAGLLVLLLQQRVISRMWMIPARCCWR